ncbi:MAG: YajQ family cyclic di-GMP-binding protein [Gammaproteobacteria bacterium]|nr:YajQ family cyclic di-GMP-binding protein [Gammaproteobacteria bacterium]
MPSFDVVSQVDKHELSNAVDQCNREITNRFDFKDSGAHVEQQERELTLVAQAEFQIKQMHDILRARIAKRGIDVACLEFGEIRTAGQEARQIVTVREGIDTDTARKIIKHIKDAKLKVQAAIQQEQVRITGKQRDDLQDTIALLKKGDFGLPLQYLNFRD